MCCSALFIYFISFVVQPGEEESKLVVTLERVPGRGNNDRRWLLWYVQVNTQLMYSETKHAVPHEKAHLSLLQMFKMATISLHIVQVHTHLSYRSGSSVTTCTTAVLNAECRGFELRPRHAKDVNRVLLVSSLAWRSSSQGQY